MNNDQDKQTHGGESQKLDELEQDFAALIDSIRQHHEGHAIRDSTAEKLRECITAIAETRDKNLLRMKLVEDTVSLKDVTLSQLEFAHRILTSDEIPDNPVGLLWIREGLHDRSVSIIIPESGESDIDFNFFDDDGNMRLTVELCPDSSKSTSATFRCYTPDGEEKARLQIEGVNLRPEEGTEAAPDSPTGPESEASSKPITDEKAEDIRALLITVLQHPQSFKLTEAQLEKMHEAIGDVPVTIAGSQEHGEKEGGE